jgi:LacI family transcriptional regulator
MAHRFLVKDIALQAGVSVATVDRVLHGRAGTRAHTVRRVEQAMRELERQSAQVGLAGRKFMIDVVMQAPARFADVTRAALEAEMPALHPAVFRARWHLAEDVALDVLVATLDGIAARGSHGVLLKAPDLPPVRAAIERLAARRIPVVTVVTDVPRSPRAAYVGMDNRAAGETAAYLVGRCLPRRRAGVLVSLSSSRFQGEEERETGFRHAIRERHPQLAVRELSGGLGLHGVTARLVRERLREWPDVQAVYSIGGANAAILEAFGQLGRTCRFFVGHDLDADNLPLLRRGAVHVLLHHDLAHDMRAACRHVMLAHGVGAGSGGVPGLSSVQVVTPFNLPAGIERG